MPKTEKGVSAVIEIDGASLAQRPRVRYLEELSKWFAILMLGVFPLVIGPEKYYNITRVKFLTFCTLQAAYLLLAALLLFDELLFSRDRFEKRRADGFSPPSLPQLLLVGFLLCSCVSALASPYRSSTWLGMARYEGLCSTLLYCGTFLLLSLWGE